MSSNARALNNAPSSSNNPTATTAGTSLTPFRTPNPRRQRASVFRHEHELTSRERQVTSTQQQRPDHHGNPSIHPQFRSKAVCRLFCKHCNSTLCTRGMKAILLGNIKVELYSTDVPPKGVQLVWNDYTTQNCHCRIRDAACLGCGNIVGYHVTQGCHSCLKSCHNGHFWMFHSDGVGSNERMDDTGLKPLKWANLPTAESDKPSEDRRHLVQCVR